MKDFVVKEHSVELFYRKFQPKDEFDRIRLEGGNAGNLGADFIFIKNLEEIRDYERVVFEVTDVGHRTFTYIEAKIAYNIEQYDNLLLKLVKDANIDVKLVKKT